MLNLINSACVRKLQASCADHHDQQHPVPYLTVAATRRLTDGGARSELERTVDYMYNPWTVARSSKRRETVTQHAAVVQQILLLCVCVTVEVLTLSAIGYSRLPRFWHLLFLHLKTYSIFQYPSISTSIIKLIMQWQGRSSSFIIRAALQ